MDNFDLKKYLVENKVTTNSQMMNEAETTFTLTYNTDPDDLEYVERMLSKKGISAKVKQGTFDDEVEIIFANSRPVDISGAGGVNCMGCNITCTTSN